VRFFSRSSRICRSLQRIGAPSLGSGELTGSQSFGRSEFGAAAALGCCERGGV